MLTVIVLANLALGFLFGKYHERWNWNALIHAGIIPSPRRRRA